jgi:hypothetical protein
MLAPFSALDLVRPLVDPLGRATAKVINSVGRSLEQVLSVTFWLRRRTRHRSRRTRRLSR